jgi:2-acylglycerol O-acyltransferase 2
MKILNKLELAPFNIPLERRLQTLGVFFFVFMFMQGLSLIGVTIVIYLLFTQFYWISLAYMVWMYFDLNRSQKGGRMSRWVRNWEIWKHYCRYFPIELVKTTDLDPEKNYLFCVSPHGVMCFGIFGNFATEGNDFSSKFPGITPHLLTLNAQFISPLMREIFMTSGACSASEKSIKYILNNEGRCSNKGQVFF